MSSSASPRLLSTDDSALDIEISDIENKGCGILALRDFKKGEFVVEYAGDLINIDDAKVNLSDGSGTVMILVTLVMTIVIMLGSTMNMVTITRTNVKVLLKTVSSPRTERPNIQWT